MEVVIHVAADGGHEAERDVDLVLETRNKGQSQGHVRGPVHVTENGGTSVCFACFVDND